MTDPTDDRGPTGGDLFDYYSARAGEYDRIYAKPERQADLRRLEEWLPELVAGRRVLEVACGTGYWTRFLAARAAAVTATDASEQTLAIARAKPPAASEVSFRRADVFDLPDDLRLFHAAVACFFWSHLAARDRPRFYRSLHRHLEPGARVILVDNLYVPGSSTPISRTDSAGDTWQRRELADGRSWEVRKNFPTEELLRAEAAPFAAEAEYRALDYFWVFRYDLAADRDPAAG